MTSKLFIGIDVSKDWLDIAVHEAGRAIRIANTGPAIAAWSATLAPQAGALVAFEPTGGYERALRQALDAAGIAWARVHPTEIAALVGLAPRTRDSGRHRARASTGHGRPGIRRVLFNAARAAIRWNPVLKAFYDRLVQLNKRPGKVALTAVMRKLLVILNAIARDNQPWRHANPA